MLYGTGPYGSGTYAEDPTPVAGGVTKPLIGSASTPIGASAGLSVTRSLAGTAGLAIEGNGNLTSKRPLAGTAGLAVDSAGLLASRRALTGTGSVAIHAAAPLHRRRRVAGISDVAIHAVAPLRARRRLLGKANLALHAAGPLRIRMKSSNCYLAFPAATRCAQPGNAEHDMVGFPGAGFIGSAAGTGWSAASNNTSHTATLPSGKLAGEHVIVFMAMDGGSGTSGPAAAGWSEPWNLAHSSNAMTGAAWVKKWLGTEPANLALTVGDSQMGSTISFRIRGAPNYGSSWKVAQSQHNGTNHPQPTVVGLDPNETYFMFSVFEWDSSDNLTGYSTPTNNVKQQHTNTGGASVAIATALVTGVTSWTPPSNFTTTTSEESISSILAIPGASNSLEFRIDMNIKTLTGTRNVLGIGGFSTGGSNELIWRTAGTKERADLVHNVGAATATTTLTDFWVQDARRQYRVRWAGTDVIFYRRDPAVFNQPLEDDTNWTTIFTFNGFDNINHYVLFGSTPIRLMRRDDGSGWSAFDLWELEIYANGKKKAWFREDDDTPDFGTDMYDDNILGPDKWSWVGTDPTRVCATKALVGKANLATDAKALLRAKRRVSGKANHADTANAVLPVRRRLTGTGSVAIDATGVLSTGGGIAALAGSANVATDAAGLLSATRTLTGSADTATDSVATLTVRRLLTGSADTAIDASGDLPVRRTVAGTGGLVTDASGDLPIRRGLAGLSAVAIETTGILTVQGLAALAGSANVATDAAGSLFATRALAGTANLAADAAGTLGLRRPLVGAASVAVDASGALTVKVRLDGTAPVPIDASALLTITRGLTGTAGLATDASGFLTVGELVALAGTAGTVIDATAVLSVTRRLTGSADSAIDVDGILTVLTLFFGPASVVAFVIPVLDLDVSVDTPATIKAFVISPVDVETDIFPID